MIDTNVPYEAVGAPSLANFEIRVVKGGALDLGGGQDLQASMIGTTSGGSCGPASTRVRASTPAGSRSC